MSQQAQVPTHRKHRVERLTYATVVLMSVLAVTEQWEHINTLAGVAVVVAPLLALAIAHLFADSLEAHTNLERPLTSAEWARCARDQWDYLVAAIPALAALAVAWFGFLDAETTISLLLWIGVATLVALAATAAHRAGLRSWRLLLAALAGGLVGLLVISLQILLKPH